MFARLLETYSHPAGGKWTGPRMQEATGGFVNAAYFSNLLAGRIKQPGLDKLKVIAEVMGFPPRLWLEEPDRWDWLGYEAEASSPGTSLKDRLNNLFASVVDERTREPLTNTEVSRRTAGKVSEPDLEAMRSGTLDNPTVEQVLALSEAFDVDPAYWFRRSKNKPLVDQEIVEALRNKDNRLLLHRSLGLSKDQKDMLLILMEQLEKREEEDSV
jgi:transcriptional regulator with XRE-family HTH domain